MINSPQHIIGLVFYPGMTSLDIIDTPLAFKRGVLTKDVLIQDVDKSTIR